MEVSGEKVIDAPQARVYAALHDPVVLRRAIPGLQTLEKRADGRFAVAATLTVGPLRPTFEGTVAVYNEDSPSGYSLRGEALAGAAGVVSGNAHVALAAIDAETTTLAYHVTADLAGQIGALECVRIDVTARTLVAEFFSRLEAILENEATGDDPAGEASVDGAEDDTPRPAAPPAGTAPTLRPVAAAPTLRPAAAAPTLGPAAAAPTLGPAAGVIALYAPGGRAYQPPRYLPQSNYPDLDVLGEPLGRPIEASMTDATGGLVESATEHATSLAQRYPGTLPQTPYRSPYRTGYEAADTVVHDGSGVGVGRWLVAALGVVVIALLLNNGFSGI